ncbi:xanthine dehydrogenase family protein subunit M [Bacillus sp. FJAT-29790]|uniref:FAD binding domain-containing protein n=1 Tax=Bacillus sp. FJAT-29790 TaxID=1895002 RepID=UPI001C24035B|nr:xanthine dehydrogenase family protein subunit M [Bacillus sp. FJAT-29790]MBU8878570.1 xanthine dehydrogenase family protein subunit M [Bacillus sp. FJAT-29790]
MLVSEIDIVSPTSLNECLSIISKKGTQHRLIAGGTDAVVRMKEGKWRPETWINIKGINELRYIKEKDGAIHIGPLTTHTDMIHSPLLQKKADVLVEAAREVGAIQMQNMGTIGGNIGTASPAGDTIPALSVLGAAIELCSISTKRLVPIEEFFLGPGRTVLKQNEMITNIIFQPQNENEIGIFQKLGPRKAQSISIVNVAISLIMGKERQCLGGKIAFGSVAPTIIRAKKCESILTLKPLTDEFIQNIAKIAWKEVMPITDVRATAEYRRDMASSLLERGLYRLMRRWETDASVKLGRKKS